MTSPKISVINNTEKALRKYSPANRAKAMHAVVNQAILDMERYVPKEAGDLRSSAFARENEAVYNTPYARAQFYGTNGRVTFNNYTESGTGSRWDLRAKQVHGEDWAKIAAKELEG